MLGEPDDMNDDFLRGMGIGVIIGGITVLIATLKGFKIKLKDLFKQLNLAGLGVLAAGITIANVKVTAN